jgi:hypothetical protein
MKKYKEFEVHEITVGQLMPIMDMMESNPRQFQIELAKAAIYKDGQPIGDGLNNIGISDYLKLTSLVMEVSGLGGEGKG